MSTPEIVLELRRVLPPAAQVTWNHVFGNADHFDLFIERADGSTLFATFATWIDEARVSIDDYIFEPVPNEVFTEFARMFVADLFTIRATRRPFLRWLQFSMVVDGVSYSSFRRAKNIEPWEESHLSFATEPDG